MKIRLAGIRHNTSADGYGWRTVYFSQGCKHHCQECFNPETWSFRGGQLLDTKDIIQKFKDNKEYDLVDGVTFSGGDPFFQPQPFALLAKEFKKMKVNIWAYTGFKFEELLKLANKNKAIKELINNVDVIVDGRFEISLKDPELKYRGSANQRIIDVPKSLKQKKIITLAF